MKKVLIISGKGGTGKTTVAGALADLAHRRKRLVLVDADVDAANLELLLSPEPVEAYSFMGSQVAKINGEICTLCGRCAQVCRFEAIRVNGEYRVDEALCEGCHACLHQCPAGAITMLTRQSGEWYRSETRFGPLFHAFLYPGEENSGKLVTELKQAAEKQARFSEADIFLVDGPPGIGCPVTASCRGMDLAILVSEPSVSGLHDLGRAQEITSHFRIPACLVLNKADLNPATRADILALAAQSGMPLLGEIPYDESLIWALSQAQPATSVLDNHSTDALKSVWAQLESILAAD